MALALTISDAKLLAFGQSLKSLSEVDAPTRGYHAAAGCARVEGAVAQQWRDVTAWGSDCEEAAASLAAWSLIGRRGYNPGSGADGAVKARVELTEEWLDLVAKGVRTPAGGFAATRVVRAHVSSGGSRFADRGRGCGGCGDSAYDRFRARR